MGDKAGKTLIGKATQFVNNLSWEEPLVQEDGRSSRESSEVVMQLLRTVTIEYKQPSVRKSFISVDES